MLTDEGTLITGVPSAPRDSGTGGAPVSLGGYAVLEPIGSGGMATVYRARGAASEEVALKVMHPHLRAREDVAERFVREARAVARLKHPNIVEVLGVSAVGEAERYQVVELVRGPSLRELLRRHGRLPAELAVGVALELAAGLAHAHRAGVIHRDVKPENVLVDLAAPARPRIKLADFGIAKLLDTHGMTATGQVLGSPAHMAPEQLDGGAITERLDVYGAGVLLYECLTGRLPFDGASPAQVLRAVLAGEPAPPEALIPEIGARLSRLVLRCIDRDPAARPSDCERLGRELAAELEGLGFDEPLAELGAFLVDTEAYWARYRERVATRLLARAATTDRASSASDLQRALALRPDDRELLRRVQRQLRGSTARRRWLGVATAASGLVAVAALALSMSWLGGDPERAEQGGDALAAEPHDALVSEEVARRTGAETGEGAAEAAALASGEASVVRPLEATEVGREGAAFAPPSLHSASTAPREPSAEASSGTVPVAIAASSRGATPLGAAEVVPASSRDTLRPAPVLRATRAETRQVVVAIRGATGGSLRIDGRAAPWQGAVHALTVGEHLFEFVPPSEDCCVEPKPERVVIRAGRPEDGPQRVTGRIEFRPASLRVPALPPGAVVDCPLLVSRRIGEPGTLGIPMTAPTRRASCTLSRRAGEAPPVTRPVTLRAGRETTLEF